MNTRVEAIANAVLYEGYILYPYRPSAIKNRHRFNFGVLYPRQYCEAQSGSDAWSMQTECLVTGSPATSLEVKARFLQLSGQNDWREGHEREVAVMAQNLISISEQPLLRRFAFAVVRGGLTPVEGALELAASPVGEGLYKITVGIRNMVEPMDSPCARDEALLRSMISVHSILRVKDGQFVSLIDPPPALRDATDRCQNVGTWPVLAGEEGARDTMLSAPIILYDYPQIAPESPGDLFDGTEIDEILALRILTMTEAEKFEVRNSDDRARLILERTEMMPPEHFQKLHGAMRGLRPNPGESR